LGSREEEKLCKKIEGAEFVEVRGFQRGEVLAYEWGKRGAKKVCERKGSELAALLREEQKRYFSNCGRKGKKRGPA